MSDLGEGAEVSREELERVRAELGIAEAARAEEGAEWEAEILADLNDFELVEQVCTHSWVTWTSKE